MTSAAFEVVTIPIGSYKHHQPFEEIDDEVKKILRVFRQLGGVENVPPAAGHKFDETAVKERLRDWVSRSVSENGVLVWLGHGVSVGYDAWLATFETSRSNYRKWDRPKDAS